MNNDNDRDKDKDRDGRSEVLNAALVEVEKAMARENAPTRNAVLVQENPSTNMLENLERMVCKIRTMADKLEDFLRMIKIFQVITEMNKKGKPFSPESLISLVGINTGGKNADNFSSKVSSKDEDKTVGEKENGIDVENLLHKMLEEDPDMASNPLAKLLLQMLEEKKS